ncbi:MAG: hypothetical protein IJW31_09105 [Lentisphaeria bacterium]|nr:hypothetical protein [Lentisphaeria bacterium]
MGIHYNTTIAKTNQSRHSERSEEYGEKIYSFLLFEGGVLGAETFSSFNQEEKVSAPKKKIARDFAISCDKNVYKIFIYRT